MRRVFRRLIRRVNTTEWSVSWFEVLPGENPGALLDRLDESPPHHQGDGDGASQKPPSGQDDRLDP
jgi:hypothetical protein